MKRSSNSLFDSIMSNYDNLYRLLFFLHSSLTNIFNSTHLLLYCYFIGWIPYTIQSDLRPLCFRISNDPFQPLRMLYIWDSLPHSCRYVSFLYITPPPPRNVSRETRYCKCRNKKDFIKIE
jgi:hypothetical protein